MNHSELREKHIQVFGNPIAHFPEDLPSWEEAPCSVFFAPYSHWVPFRLRYCVGFEVHFKGPFSTASSPIKIPADGYLVLLNDN